MASESVINTLLQQEFAKRNQPNQGLAQILQIMEGIAKGLAIYDASKAIPAKYGTSPTTQTSTIPGVPPTPGVPEVPGQSVSASDSLRAMTMDTRGNVPGFLSGFNPAQSPSATVNLPGIPAIPGTPGIPAQQVTKTTPGQLGTVDAEMLKALQGLQGPGVDAAYSQILKKHGLEGQISPIPTFIPTQNPDGSYNYQQAPGKIKFPPPPTTQAATFFDERSGKYFQFNAAGKKVQATEVPKSGVQKIDDKSSTNAKTQQEKLSRALDIAETDAAKQADVQVPDFRRFTSPDAYNAVFQREYKKILFSRIGADFPRQQVNEALYQRFGTLGDIGAAMDYKKKNPTQVEAIKKKIQATKLSGGMATLEDQIAAKADLSKLGVPEAFIDELIRGVMAAQ